MLTPKLLTFVKAPAIALITLAAAVCVSLLPTRAQAANPAEGTVDPSTITSVSWDGTAIGTGGTDETTAIEGINRDTFILHVAPGTYTGKVIAVSLKWTSGANDYDLYIHKRNADGSDGDFVQSSGGGAPGTSENTAFDPNIWGTGDFNVIAVYFINTPGADQPHGTATVTDAQATRTAKYLSGGMTFAPNSPVKAQTRSLMASQAAGLIRTAITTSVGFAGYRRASISGISICDLPSPAFRTHCSIRICECRPIAVNPTRLAQPRGRMSYPPGRWAGAILTWRQDLARSHS